MNAQKHTAHLIYNSNSRIGSMRRENVCLFACGCQLLTHEILHLCSLLLATEKCCTNAILHKQIHISTWSSACAAILIVCVGKQTRCRKCLLFQNVLFTFSCIFFSSSSCRFLKCCAAKIGNINKHRMWS